MNKIATVCVALVALVSPVAAQEERGAPQSERRQEARGPERGQIQRRIEMLERRLEELRQRLDQDGAQAEKGRRGGRRGSRGRSKREGRGRRIGRRIGGGRGMGARPRGQRPGFGGKRGRGARGIGRGAGPRRGVMQRRTSVSPEVVSNTMPGVTSRPKLRRMGGASSRLLAAGSGSVGPGLPRE